MKEIHTNEVYEHFRDMPKIWKFLKGTSYAVALRRAAPMHCYATPTTLCHATPRHSMLCYAKPHYATPHRRTAQRDDNDFWPHPRYNGHY